MLKDIAPGNEADTGTANGGGGTPDPNESANKETDAVGGQETDTTVIDEESSAETEKTDTSSSEDTLSDTPKDQQKKGSDHVPYSRFKEINDARIEAEKRVGAYEERLQGMESKLQEFLKPKSQPLYDDPEQQKVVDYYVNPALKQAIEPLMKDITELKNNIIVERESLKLEKMLDGLSTKYPIINEIPKLRDLIMNTYVMDNKCNMDELAKGLQQTFGNRDKKIINDYLAGKKKSAEHKAGTPTGSAVSFQQKPLPKGASVDEIFDAAERNANQRFTSK